MLLYPRPEPAGSPLNGLPGNVAGDLPDGSDQGPLGAVKGSVNISTTYGKHKKFQWIKSGELGPTSLETGFF